MCVYVTQSRLNLFSLPPLPTLCPFLSPLPPHPTFLLPPSFPPLSLPPYLLPPLSLPISNSLPPSSPLSPLPPPQGVQWLDNGEAVTVSQADDFTKREVRFVESYPLSTLMQTEAAGLLKEAETLVDSLVSADILWYKFCRYMYMCRLYIYIYSTCARYDWYMHMYSFMFVFFSPSPSPPPPLSLSTHRTFLKAS